MSLTAEFVIQPSSDSKATAIAVAWIIANRVKITAGDPEEAAKKQAALVGELAGQILDHTSKFGH